MALLEKQKLMKMSKLSVAALKSKPSNSITVSVPNDLFNHQPKSDQQIVQLNGKNTKPSTENKTVPSLSVDADVPKKSSDVSRISTETTVHSEIISNSPKPNLPELCVQPKGPITAIEKSNKNIQTFSALSDNDKNKLLQKTESEYMMHR